ncbi:hypothetical protein, partial [Pseudophaeobacter profundi]|uniref:hypothetical protein n=1 Tax=Pseudophaeobacter profundi TaxID=3034152 RepID=UPI00242EB202
KRSIERRASEVFNLEKLDHKLFSVLLWQYKFVYRLNSQKRLYTKTPDFAQNLVVRKENLLFPSMMLQKFTNCLFLENKPPK